MVKRHIFMKYEINYTIYDDMKKEMLARVMDSKTPDHAMTIDTNGIAEGETMEDILKVLAAQFGYVIEIKKEGKE